MFNYMQILKITMVHHRNLDLGEFVEASTMHQYRISAGSTEIPEAKRRYPAEGTEIPGAKRKSPDEGRTPVKSKTPLREFYLFCASRSAAQTPRRGARTIVKSKTPLREFFLCLHGDSNSGFDLERVASWSPRRWRQQQERFYQMTGNRSSIW